jgi:trehalose/maltose transport system substrate-binding protein
VLGAGPSLVSQAGQVTATDQAIEDAARVVRRLATTRAAPAGLGTNKEDEARLGFESGRSNYQVNYSFIYPSAAEVSEDFQKNIGWARYPRTDKDKPSRPPLGGINIGVGAYTRNRDLAFDAATCLASPENQLVAAEKGGLAPTSASVYDDPALKKAFPFADLLEQSIEEGAPRPVTPAYSDISLAIQKTFHPPESVDPEGIVEQLQNRMEKAGNGEIF